MASPAQTKKADQAKKTTPAVKMPGPRVPAPKVMAETSDMPDITVSTKAKGTGLKMKDLVEQVAAKAAGGKKKGVKEIVEATLAALGDALGRGEAINLPGFGRAKVAHAEDKTAGKPMTIKMKTQSPGDAKKPRKEALAEAAE